MEDRPEREREREREKEPNKQVYIGHLPYDVEKRDLEDLFAKFG